MKEEETENLEQFAKNYFSTVKEDHQKKLNERAERLIEEWRSKAKTEAEFRWLDEQIANLDSFVAKEKVKLENLLSEETLMDIDTGNKKRSIHQTAQLDEDDDPDL